MKRTSLADQAYQELLSAVAERRLEPGSISETELATMLGISRTPVRAALLRLQLEGQVERQAGGRLTIRPYSAQEVEQLYELRALLEVHATGLAASRISDSELEELDGLLAADREALSLFRVDQLAALNDQIHAVVLRASRNRTLAELVSELRRRTHGLGAFIVGDADHQARFVADHEELVRLLREGDAAAAQQLVRGHVERARDILLSESVIEAKPPPMSPAMARPRGGGSARTGEKHSQHPQRA